MHSGVVGDVVSVTVPHGLGLSILRHGPTPLLLGVRKSNGGLSDLGRIVAPLVDGSDSSLLDVSTVNYSVGDGLGHGQRGQRQQGDGSDGDHCACVCERECVCGYG